MDSNDSGHSGIFRENECGKPTVGCGNTNGNILKCLDCLMGMETPDGIWCLKFKGLVNETMAGKCKEFMKKETAQAEESDRYDW